MKQQQPLTLRRNFSWTFVGNIIYGACQWGILAIIAKMTSPEMLGQFTLGLAVNAPVVMLTNLQLRQIQVTDIQRKYVFGDYLALRVICIIWAFIAILIITIVKGYRLETSSIILLISFAKAFDSLSDIIYGLLQQQERMDRIAISMIIKGFLSLLLLTVGIYLTGNVSGGIVGLIIAWAIVLFSYDFYSGALILSSIQIRSNFEEIKLSKLAVLKPRWQIKNLRELVWIALPLGLVMMLISLSSNIPPYFIEHYFGEEKVGIYSAIAYLMVIGDMVILALGQAAIPRLAKYYGTGNSIAFSKLLLKLLGIGAVLGTTAIFIAIVAGEKILTIIYQTEYGKYADLLVWFMIVAAIRYISSFLGQGITAARYFRIQLPLFTLVTIISGLTCLYLLPTHGLQGAVMALFTAAITQLFISLGIIFHIINKIK